MPAPIPSDHIFQPGHHEQLTTATEIPVIEVADSAAAQKIQEQLNQPQKSVDPNFKITAPTPTPVEQLPPDQQVEVQKILKDVGQQIAQTQEPATSTDPEPGDHETVKKAPLCPRCGWDQRDTDPVKVEDSDKQMWLRHLLGGDRFVREYVALGGRMKIVLRSRRVYEDDLIVEQLLLDYGAGKLPGNNPAANNAAMWRYNAAVSLDRVISDGKTELFPELPVGDRKRDENCNAVGRLFNTQFVNRSVSWMGIVQDCVLHFDMLCARLQIMSREADFFVESPGAV